MADRWITINELAERLSVSVSTIRGWVRRGSLRPICYVQIGGAYRFDFDAILEASRGRASQRPQPDNHHEPEQLELDFGEEHHVKREPIHIYPIENDI